MRIQVTDKHSTKPPSILSLHALVERKVDGSDYERGELETLRATIENQTALLAFILSKLTLTHDEINEHFSKWNEELKIIP